MPHVEPLRDGDPAAVGAYRIIGRLGAGGQGVVYLGQAPDGRPVAVKVLREGVAGDDRFAKEIEAARRVEPFCIAQVLDANLGAQPYIITEYVDGPTLQQAGRHGGADLQRLAVATATALAAIHQAGVVHRDFKPANVLLGPGGPRVIDFGIARAADSAATVTSSIVGTPAYMAPEQLAGQGVGPPADVFAWASVMVWAATGTPPFGQDTLPAIINRILHNEPQLGDLPQPLHAIVYSCLAKDPAHRPTMQQVLLHLLGGAPEPGPTTPARERRKGRRPPLLVAGAAAAAVVVVAAVTTVVVWRTPSEGETGHPSVAAATSPKPTPTPTSKGTPTKRTTPRPKRTPTTTPTTVRQSSTPTATTATKKPVVSARFSVLAIDISAGPGQDDAAGCLMPPVHFQSEVESTKRGIWFNRAWTVDGKQVDSSKQWVPEDTYTAAVTSGQYMLKAGRHTVALKVTSPSAAARSLSFDVCALETW